MSWLQNLKRSKELCRSFALDSFGQPKPSPDRSSLKLTLKQEVEFCISTHWFDGTSVELLDTRALLLFSE